MPSHDTPSNHRCGVDYNYLSYRWDRILCLIATSVPILATVIALNGR